VSCETLSDKLSGYLDRELDERAAGEVEVHLRQCISCSARFEGERRLRAAVQANLTPLRAPERLRSNVRAMLRAQVKRSRPRRTWLPTWAATAAALLLSVMGVWLLGIWQVSRVEGSDVVAEVVAGHVRSLQGAHLTDIASSEHHTVKPWFAGKLDFSPPVPDFSTEGFPLIGGRLDYVREKEVAALVYGRQQHVINLFVWPSPDSHALPTAASRRGYHVLHGAAGGMTYWAVSDLNESDLSHFAHLVAGDLSGTAVQP
jgi:anti-sigma factor (TIGR02949 family)